MLDSQSLKVDFAIGNAGGEEGTLPMLKNDDKYTEGQEESKRGDQEDPSRRE